MSLPPVFTPCHPTRSRHRAWDRCRLERLDNGKPETRLRAKGTSDRAVRSKEEGWGLMTVPAASFLSLWMLHFLTEIPASLSLPLFLAVVRVGIRKILSVLESGLPSVGAGSDRKWPFRGSARFLAPVITLVLFNEHGCTPETGRL